MPEGKYIEQKKQMFDDVTFAMTPFSAKKNSRLLVEEKNPKHQNNLKSSLIRFFK